MNSKSNQQNEVVVNEAARPFGEHADAIRLNGWMVVNAPRPLPGTVAWCGEFRHGTFYAAGPAEDFGEAWGDLDAWPVRTITNMQITQILAAKAQGEGISLSEFAEDWGSMGALARAADLPWHDA